MQPTRGWLTTAKMIKKMDNLSYMEMLEMLYGNALGFRRRQLRGDIVERYKIMHDVKKADKDFFFLSFITLEC